MRRILLAALLALVFRTMAMAAAPAAPSGLAATPLANGMVTLSWVDDPTVYQWFIYINGAQLYSPGRTTVSGPTGGMDSILISGLNPAQLPAAVTMKAVAAGGVSALSSTLTINQVTNVPFQYVYPAPGAVFMLELVTPTPLPTATATPSPTATPTPSPTATPTP
jgi:hypothetical protein